MISSGIRSSNIMDTFLEDLYTKGCAVIDMAQVPKK